MKLKLFALLAALMPIAAFSADKLDSGDTAWMMISTALVLLMTPAGLALFYAGMTRSKNALNTYAMVMGAFVLAFVVWIVAGYSLAFGTAGSEFVQKFIGGFGNILLSETKWTDLSGSYPTYVFVAFHWLSMHRLPIWYGVVTEHSSLMRAHSTSPVVLSYT